MSIAMIREAVRLISINVEEAIDERWPILRDVRTAVSVYARVGGDILAERALRFLLRSHRDDPFARCCDGFSVFQHSADCGADQLASMEEQYEVLEGVS